MPCIHAAIVVAAVAGGSPSPTVRDPDGNSRQARKRQSNYHDQGLRRQRDREIPITRPHIQEVGGNCRDPDRFVYRHTTEAYTVRPRPPPELRSPARCSKCSKHSRSTTSSWFPATPRCSPATPSFPRRSPARIALNIPFVSSAMDTVTEARLGDRYRAGPVGSASSTRTWRRRSRRGRSAWSRSSRAGSSPTRSR